MIRKVIRRLIGRSSSKSAMELIQEGAEIGNNFKNYGSIDVGHSFLFKAGNNVTIAADALILTHDASTDYPIGYTKVGRVELGNNVFIGARAIILPNTKIGSNCIIGAGSVVTSDVPDNSVYGGNPAKFICSYDSYIKKMSDIKNNSLVIDKYWKDMSKEEKEMEKAYLKDGGVGFDL